ncbi:MAG: hypothetical protein LBB47_00260 [Spirochaetaceae bacterium]|nr:hypothetical protein [Spirochaetaceae bacterium]
MYISIVRKTVFTFVAASCAFLFFSSFNAEKIKDIPEQENISAEKKNLPATLAVGNEATSGEAVEASSDNVKSAAPLTLSSAAAIMLDSDILAFYGHPVAKKMGILGRYPKDELTKKLSALADEYRAESGGRGIVKAFYIIYGTVQPEGNILTMDQIDKTLLKEWIEYAQERGMLIFLDHQIGKYDPVKSLASMFQYLKYPNVHLAIDPEWRTTKPMLEFGCVTGDEINRAQQAMQDYILENNIEGDRMLVIHQFREVMIRNRADIKADFERVRLVHCMDGVGTPKEKLDTYKFNALAKNIPVKAFKLFYDFKLPGVLVDTPLLTPKEVYALDPRPAVIMYQ